MGASGGFSSGVLTREGSSERRSTKESHTGTSAPRRSEAAQSIRGPGTPALTGAGELERCPSGDRQLGRSGRSGAREAARSEVGDLRRASASASEFCHTFLLV